MPHGRCAADDCGTEGELRRGWCLNCYTWSRRNGWADPSRRGRHRSPDAAPLRCSVTFDDGVLCGRARHGRSHLCEPCLRWSQRNPDGRVESRPRQRSNGGARAALEAAAWAETDECVILTGYRDRPVIRVDGTSRLASRQVWIIRHGDPGEAHVLHTCHRGEDGCINIRHLYLGDQARNMADMAEAGRSKLGREHMPGEGNPAAVLTEEQALEIHRRWTSGKRYPHPDSTGALAEEFGISRTQVKRIGNGRGWASVLNG